MARETKKILSPNSVRKKKEGEKNKEKAGVASRERGTETIPDNRPHIPPLLLPITQYGVWSMVLITIIFLLLLLLTARAHANCLPSSKGRGRGKKVPPMTHRLRPRKSRRRDAGRLLFSSSPITCRFLQTVFPARSALKDSLLLTNNRSREPTSKVAS